MIYNQWYAVMDSNKVKVGKVVGARRFGEDLVFFRTEGGALGCVSSLCAHRGASLAKGCVRDGHIQCPFHGIEYDTDGKCVYIPSEGKASTKDFSRFNLKHYPVREIGGIIFVWYGDAATDKSETAGNADGNENIASSAEERQKGSNVAEPDIFDIITDSSYTYDHTEDTWGVHYSRVIENQLDVSHLPFVHRTTIGRGNKTLANGPKVVWLDDSTLQTSANNEVDTGQLPLAAKDSIIKSTNLNFKFPNMWLNHVSDKMQILAFFIPVDEEHSIIALRFYNKITGIKAIDKCIAWLGSRANRIVEKQDKRIVETQLPKKSGMGIGENLVQADKPIMEYRKKRAELQNFGLK